MKKRLPFIIFLIAASFTGLFLYNKYRVAPVMNFYKLTVLDSTGTSVNLEKFRGKKLLVTYYASWCGDCLRELKSLNEIKNEKLSDIEVIAITDEAEGKMTAFQRKKHYPFYFFRINKSFSEMKVYSIPVNYIVNRKGQTVWEKVGAVNWNDNDYLQLVKRME